MNTKTTQLPKTKRSRTNTPRSRGEYKSYSLRILKRDLDRLQKKARREKISFNTFMVNALMEKLVPAPKPEEIDDPSKYRDLAVVEESINANP